MLRIDLREFSLAFGTRCVIDNLSATFHWPGGNSAAPEDYVLALMGPSGAGKTSLVRQILQTRYEQPSRPDIGIEPSDAVIAYLPQRPVLFPHLPIDRNARLLQGVGRYRGRFDAGLFAQLALRLRLQNMLGSRVSVDRLSGGEAQRLMLLRTLSVRPDLVILDEPGAGLDPSVRETFLMDLQDLLTRLEIAAIYITHHWDEVNFLAGRVAFAEVAPNGSDARPIRRLDVVPKSTFASCPPTIDAFRTVHGPGCSVWPVALPESPLQHDSIACFVPPEGANMIIGFHQSDEDLCISKDLLARLDQGQEASAAIYREGRFAGWRTLSRNRLLEVA